MHGERRLIARTDPFPLHPDAHVHVAARQDIGGFLAQVLVNVLQLLKSPAVDGLEKTALLDPVFRGDILTGKVILFENLKKMPARGMLLQVIKDQGFQISRLQIFEMIGNELFTSPSHLTN